MRAIWLITSLLVACADASGGFDLDPAGLDDQLRDPGGGTPADPCDGSDNDVDGIVDNGCYCAVGEVQACFPGDPKTRGVGACEDGIQGCVHVSGDFGLGEWGECSGAVVASPEICGNAVDEDCDGYVAPCQAGDVTGLPCHPGQSSSCYTGPPGTEERGICMMGVRECAEGDVWGPCEGEVTPMEEVCGNLVDENCDGADPAC